MLPEWAHRPLVVLLRQRANATLTSKRHIPHRLDTRQSTTSHMSRPVVELFGSVAASRYLRRGRRLTNLCRRRPHLREEAVYTLDRGRHLT